jgi:hypothetical protein
MLSRLNAISSVVDVTLVQEAIQIRPEDSIRSAIRCSNTSRALESGIAIPHRPKKGGSARAASPFMGRLVSLGRQRPMIIADDR